MRSPIWIAAAATVTLLGCSAGYVYRPEENATAKVSGHSAAYYAIPPGTAEGDVKVASFGIAQISPKRSNVAEGRVLHVRLIIENSSAQPWTVDTREQRADIRGEGRVAPVMVRSDGGNPPVLRVAPHGSRTVDLFFPLPRGALRAKQVPEFDALWQVQTDARLVAQRTPFERTSLNPYYVNAYWEYPYGAGPYTFAPKSWNDPLWGPDVVPAQNQ